MILCVCRNIAEDQLKKLIHTGLSVDEACRRLGIGSDCGLCILESLADQGPTAALKSPKNRQNT